MRRSVRLTLRALVGLVAVLATFSLGVAPAPAQGPGGPKGPTWAELNKRLDALVEEAAAAGVTMSVTVKDLSSSYQDAVARAGGNETVKAASVIKLPLLALLMDQVDDGLLSLDTLVTIPTGSSNIVGGAGTLRTGPFPLTSAHRRRRWLRRRERL